MTLSERIDAIICDASQRQALVAVRDLGRGGARCALVDSDPRSPAFASRYASKRIVPTPFAASPDAYADELVRACRDLAPRALFPLHDGSIEAIRARRTDFEAHAALALAREEALAMAIDKTRTLAVAADLGLAVPRSAVVADIAEADAAVDEVGLPAVVKPSRSWVSERLVGTRLTSLLVTDRAQASAAVSTLLTHGAAAIVQEWLPGDREAVSFVYAGGRVWASFAQRATRTWPPLGGNSVRRESIALPADIAGDATRLIGEIDLEGYSEVEFRRDAAGRAALMEINPRLSASVEIAVRSGVPFPRLVYQWALGEPLRQSQDYRVGVRVRWLGGDFLWLKSALGEGEPQEVPSRVRALRAFVLDFGRRVGYDYVDWRDPAPALRAAIGGLRAARRDVAARVRGRARRSDELDTAVAIVGGGPYGLSIAAHLAARSVPHAVFGEPMDTWRNHMPAGMCLKSEGFASNLADPAGELTLERFCRERGLDYGDIAVPVPAETFLAYGDWFQQARVPHLQRRRVERIEPLATGFHLSLADGDALRARKVIVATGLQGHAHLPEVLSGLSGAKVVHTYDQSEPAAYRDRDVVVIGAGQSALEGAVLMHDHGARVRVVARTGELIWNSEPGGNTRPLRERLRYPQSGLGEGFPQLMYCKYPLAFHAAPEGPRIRRGYGELGPAGAWWLRRRFAECDIEVMLGRSVESCAEDDGGVVLSLNGPGGGEQLRAANVIAGTGYRPDVRRLGFLAPGVRDHIATTAGTPVLNRAFESSVPGLHFVGFPAAASFGPLMRFVYGTEFAARRLARVVS